MWTCVSPSQCKLGGQPINNHQVLLPALVVLRNLCYLFFPRIPCEQWCNQSWLRQWNQYRHKDLQIMSNHFDNSIHLCTTLGRIHLARNWKRGIPRIHHRYQELLWSRRNDDDFDCHPFGTRWGDIREAITTKSACLAHHSIDGHKVLWVAEIVW